MSTSSTEITVIDKRHQQEPVTTPEPVGLMRVIEQVASNPNFDPAKLRELYAIKKEYDADEARKAYHEAVAAFKSETITVLKDRTNSQYGSKYVSLGKLVSTVTPFLSKYGLSVRWEHPEADGKITITCFLSHLMGHTESVAIALPIDTSGAKNVIQQRKSTITYGKACTFESICGIASTDANLDDDGNGAGTTSETMPEETVAEYVDSMRQAMDESSLLRVYWDGYNKAQKLDDKSAMDTFIREKDLRKKELKNARH